MAEITNDKCHETLRVWLEFCDQMENPNPDLKKRIFLNIIDGGIMVADTFYDNGKFNEALKGFQLVLEQKSEILESSHPEVMDCRRSIAHVLAKQDKFDEAFEKYNEIDESFVYQNNLAVDLLEKGMCDKSLDFLKKVHEKAFKKLDADHMETLIYKHNFSRPLQGLRRFKEALEVMEEVYEMRKKKLGFAHVHTLSSLREIGLCLFNLCKYDESIAKLHEAYNAAIKEFKLDDPQIILIQTDMAFVLTGQGNYKEAGEIYKQILEFQSKNPQSIAFLATKTKIGDLLLKQRNYIEAVKVFTEVHNTLTEIDADKSRVSDALSKLADAYAAQGDYECALPMYKEVCTVRKELWGCEDQRTSCAQHAIGRMYVKLSNYGKAMEILEEVSTTRKKLMKRENPDLEHTSMLKAEIYAKQQKYKEAKECYEELKQIYEDASYTPGHMIAVTNIASMLCLMGKYEDALKTYELIDSLRIQPDYVDSSGREHDITTIMWEEGFNKYLVNNYEEFHKVSEKHLGKHSIITVDILNTLAGIYAREDLHEKSLNAYNEVYEAYRVMPEIGSNHQLALLNRICVIKELLRKSNFADAQKVFREKYGDLVLDEGQDAPFVIEFKKDIDTIFDRYNAETSAKANEVKDEMEDEMEAEAEVKDEMEDEMEAEAEVKDEMEAEVKAEVKVKATPQLDAASGYESKNAMSISPIKSEKSTNNEEKKI